MALPFASAGASPFKAVKPKPSFIFPRDHGAHPGFRTEWWYLTGWLDGPMGFQVTFFRFAPKVDPNNKSAFNPRQILLAHAALADPKRGRLVHEERVARAGFSSARSHTHEALVSGAAISACRISWKAPMPS